VSLKEHFDELAVSDITQAKQAQQKILELESQIVELRKAMLSDASTTFGEGIAKAIRGMKKEIESFWDSIASLTMETFKSLAASFINDLIFGNEAKAKIDQQIADIRLEMAGISEEHQRSFNQVSQMRRLEGESNDEYLQRTQRLSEIQQQQTDIYTFQTKEMELLQRINELEQERNNIILDRLKNLGQKVTDKLLDHALNLLFSTVFSGGGGSTSGGGTEPPPDATQTRAFGGGGGGLVIQFHGDVYGMDDFGQRVDQAVRTYSQRRNA
jgi:cell fate (sporulation/competence/biofilm development) regulator YlbF (YheA/YmcA/DUF963 family)